MAFDTEDTPSEHTSIVVCVCVCAWASRRKTDTQMESQTKTYIPLQQTNLNDVRDTVALFGYMYASGSHARILRDGSFLVGVLDDVWKAWGILKERDGVSALTIDARGDRGYTRI